MTKRRVPILAVLAVGGIGLLILGIAGLHLFMAATAVRLHPDPQAAPSAMQAMPPGAWTSAIDEGRRIARAGLSGQNLPGLSVAVGVGGDIVWAEGFGWADLDERTPMVPDTRLRLGTASIALTSIAVGLLVEDERLRLDDTIQTYVPDYPVKPWPVTVRRLMSHTAGVRTDAGDEGPYDESCETTVEGLKLFRDAPLLFEPGTRYRFSTFGWILVSAAAEAAAGEPFLAFMRRRVFEPLGMEDTVPDSASEPVRSRASFYFPRYAADPRYGLHQARRIDTSCYAGAGVFLSTPSDLVRFGLAIGAGRLLQPATVAMLQTPQRLASGEETGYGLGWDLETVSIAGQPTRWIGHDGVWMGGQAAALITFPDRGLVVSVMSNIAWADVEALAVQVGQAFATR